MAVDMLQAVTALLSKVSRAARKLRGSRFKLIAFRFDRRRKFDKDRAKVKYEEGYLNEEEVWRRGIIMGEKCQPLEFSGAIYYDSDGRQLIDVPRSPVRSQLPAFLVTVDKTWK